MPMGTTRYDLVSLRMQFLYGGETESLVGCYLFYSRCLGPWPAGWPSSRLVLHILGLY